jgi:hypothetical protein
MTEEQKESDKIYNAILKLDRTIEATKPSRVPLEDRLEILPGQLFVKDLDIYRIFSEIEELKPKIKAMEAEKLKEYRAMTVPGVKEGTTKPKYTVEQAEYESKFHLGLHDNKYKALKKQEKDLYTQYEMLKMERNFLDMSFKATRTLAWLKVGGPVKGVLA